MTSEIVRTSPLKNLDGLVEEFLQLFPSGGIFGLSGELGSGKTTFVRAVIKAIAKKNNIKFDRVISPSFVLHQSYEKLKPPVHHYDLYRLDKVTEAMLIELQYYDVADQVKQNCGFLFVEWPELCVKEQDLGLDRRITIEMTPTERKYRINPIRTGPK